MSDYRVIEVKQSVLASNDQKANELRSKMKEKGTLLINLMSSPGSGKTTTLRRTIKTLKGELDIAVMEADIDSDVDAAAISEVGAQTIQLHTGGMCHLDAAMCAQGLEGLAAGDADVIFLENVGNLVCPAEFDTGAGVNITILSVPEGDDKPLKYPLMYQVCDLVLVNKTDVMPYFDFDLDTLCKNVAMRNPKARVIPIFGSDGRRYGRVVSVAVRARCSVEDREVRLKWFHLAR